jgi:hypothetical protein
LAKNSTLCPEQIVEWGQSNTFELGEFGICKSWSDPCDLDNLNSDDGEHVIQFFENIDPYDVLVTENFILPVYSDVDHICLESRLDFLRRK